MKFKTTAVMTLSLFLLLSFSVYAKGHMINIINSSDIRINYLIKGLPLFNSKQTIRSGAVKQYKTRLTDSPGVSIKSGPWNASKFHDLVFHLCTPEKYIADQIATIEFTDVHKCTVTCTNGSKTSCIKSNS